MHELIHVPDHNIVAINRGNKENESNTILYKDKRNRLHTIDLDVCVENFQKNYGIKNGRCIGDRDITRGFFSFTLVVFLLKFRSKRYTFVMCPEKEFSVGTETIALFIFKTCFRN